MPRLRVLVVEDSITVRKRLCEVLSADPEIEVVGEAVNGQEATALCMTLRPDVLTMDMMLPVMSGLAATEYIMAHCPTPILVVSAVNRDELFKTFDALAAGAVDFLEKPKGDDADDQQWAQRLVSSVKLVAKIRVITHLRAKLPSATRVAQATDVHQALASAPCELIALGASTGGPGALAEVLRALPCPLPVPVLVVQHISDDFGVAFPDWLATQTTHPTRYAREGEPLYKAKGSVVLAPPSRHLIVKGGYLHLVDEAPRHSCRPSIDCLFESIAHDGASTTTACLLTGMGRDGASGMLDIRRAGGHTIAQDEATSVIYGMPREAVRLGAVEHTLPLYEIGPMLAAALIKKQKVGT